MAKWSKRSFGSRMVRSVPSLGRTASVRRAAEARQDRWQRPIVGSMHVVRSMLFFAAALWLPACLAAAAAAAADTAAHRRAVEEWRATRIENLTSESGW